MEAITKEMVDAAHDLTADDKANLYMWVFEVSTEITKRLAANPTDAMLIEQKAEVTAMLQKMSDVGIK